MNYILILNMKTHITENNIVIKIGSNAKENWELVDSCEHFTWLHLNSFPSCHVIIETINPSYEDIFIAAQLCKENTKYKNLRNLKVCYTTCGNLKKGTDIGSVLYNSKRKVKTIIV